MMYRNESPRHEYQNDPVSKHRIRMVSIPGNGHLQGELLNVLQQLDAANHEKPTWIFHTSHVFRIQFAEYGLHLRVIRLSHVVNFDIRYYRVGSENLRVRFLYSKRGVYPPG